MQQITYQKNDGCIIQRSRKTPLPYKVGDSTSMGWKVLNIEYQYKDKYYPEYKYNMLLQKEKQGIVKRKQLKESLEKEAKTFIYYFIIMVIINFLKTLFGI